MKFTAPFFALSFFAQANEIHACKDSVTSIREPVKCATYCDFYAWAKQDLCDATESLTECVIRNHKDVCHSKDPLPAVAEGKDLTPKVGITAEDIKACEWLVNEGSWFMFPSFCRPYCALYASMYAECATSRMDLVSCVMENIYCSQNTGCHGLTDDLPECLDYEFWEYPDEVTTHPWSMAGMISPWQTCRPGALQMPTGPMTWENKHYIKKCQEMTRHSALEGSVEKCQSLCEWVVTDGRDNYPDFKSRAAVTHHVWDLMPECNAYIDCDYLGTQITPPRSVAPMFENNFKPIF